MGINHDEPRTPWMSSSSDRQNTYTVLSRQIRARGWYTSAKGSVEGLG
jgi:hypothetical protein